MNYYKGYHCKRLKKDALFILKRQLLPQVNLVLLNSQAFVVQQHRVLVL